MVYLDKVEPVGGVSISTYVGFTLDPHASACGKMLISELSPEEIREMYRNRPMKKYGKNTILNVEDLLKDLERVRSEGYALDDEEFLEGIRCLAAPIRTGGRIVAAISISGSVFRMTRENMNQDLIGPLMKTGKEISSKL